METILLKLKTNGYKVTKTRHAVLEALWNAKRPLAAKDIFQAVDNIDLASVYRTLNLFQKLSLVTVENFKGESIYCISLHPHHHIICRECGKAEDFVCTHNFSGFTNFVNIQHQMLVTGICQQCNLINKL